MASPVAALLAGLALLVATGSAVAHPATTAHASPVPTTQPGILEAGVPPPPVAAPSAAPDSTALPPVAVAGALALGAMAVVIRRWPRQALAVSFVLLLTIFAFENALHSVHHGFDGQQSEECAVAAVSAHLAAISVDGTVETAFVLAVARTSAESELSSPATRLLGPDQDRAPPIPTV
jgi:fumarate reductase subunit D